MSKKNSKYSKKKEGLWARIIDWYADAQRHRIAVKRGARYRMKTPKWQPLLKALVALVILYLLNLFAYNLSGYSVFMVNVSDNYLAQEGTVTASGFINSFLQAKWPEIELQAIFLVAALIIVHAVMEAGFMNYSLKVARGLNPPVKEQFEGFNIGFKIIAIRAMQTVGTILGSVLLIVPGIIFNCMFSQAVFIAFDNPDKGPVECMKMSMSLMKGKLAEFFLLMVSFIGWYMLSAIMAMITIPLVDFWILPYKTVTYAEFYIDLVEERKKKAGA